MSKKIIIIEAPKKVNSFKKYLGSEYDIIPTYGHCVDLPSSKLSVNIKKDFEPTFEIKPDSHKIVDDIVSKCSKAQEVYLFTDLDREGESIAWHVMELIKEHTSAKIYRASTNQITKSGIENALKNPTELDMNKVNAYKARRILDRICGYKTSYLTFQSTGGRSAGRVQSAILRIMVDRENEIINFVPKEYWILTAFLNSSKHEPYTAFLSDKIEVNSEKDANLIEHKVLKSEPIVISVESKEHVASPNPPFTTIPMVGAASSIFGWQAEKTMSVAQSLYQTGKITYHRTDSYFISPDAIIQIKDYIKNDIGSKYCPDKTNVYSVKQGAQEAHECCRPTDISQEQINLSKDENLLYDLIWRRTVSSQMSCAIDKKTKVVTDIGGYDFISRGSVELFDGYRKIWTFGGSEDSVLPNLHEGEKCFLKTLDKKQEFTKPPKRYSVASLGKVCESLQITRPSTFSSSIATLKDRKYIDLVQKSFKPTKVGMKVIEFLVGANMCFVNTKFTSEMEEDLDKIQQNSTDVKTVLSKFWERLKKDIEAGKKIKYDNQITEFKCPKCDGSLLMKHSKYGPFYACVNNKTEEIKCDFIAQVGENGEPIEKKKTEKEYASFPCKCGFKMIKRNSSRGEFYGCEKFPKCRSIANLEGTFQEGKKTKYKKAKKNESD